MHFPVKKERHGKQSKFGMQIKTLFIPCEPARSGLAFRSVFACGFLMQFAAHDTEIFQFQTGAMM